MALALKDLALCEYCCEVYMKIVLKSNLSFSIKRIDHYLTKWDKKHSFVIKYKNGSINIGVCMAVK